MRNPQNSLKIEQNAFLFIFFTSMVLKNIKERYKYTNTYS